MRNQVVCRPVSPEWDGCRMIWFPKNQEGHECRAHLKGIRVDDWVFGVSSVSKDGFESPVTSAVPGGAFKPYVAPPPEPVK